MESNNIYKELQLLLNVTESYEEAQKSVVEAQNAVSSAEVYTPTRLKTFDETYKEKFIVSEAGEKPKPAAKWNPLNHTKKKKETAQVATNAYTEKTKAAEAQYYKKFKEKRSAFEQEDDDDKERKTRAAYDVLITAEQQLESAKAIWKQGTLLSDRLRQSVIIRKIMVFFEDDRVDMIKEAINLYYDEERKDEEARIAAEHRQRLEEIIAEQNESIQYAVEKVEEASANVEEAMRTAQEALERADEAYDRAEEAGSSSSSSDY